MAGRSGCRLSRASVLVVATCSLILALSIATLARAAPTAQDAAQGQAIFVQKCASCHTIGGGKLVGPDLKGVTATRPRDWLVRFITTPDQVIASGDATAQQLVQEYGGIPMPNLGLTTVEAEDVLAYIQAQSGAAAPDTTTSTAPAPVPATGNSAVGRDLFAGTQRFAKGGPPCISCHNAANLGGFEGGTWGLDLTRAYSKWGEGGVVSFMQAPPFPGMTEAFLARPLTAQEIADVTAYLAEVDAQPAPAASGWTFPVAGLAAFGIFAALAQLVWRGRLRGVREPLLRAQKARRVQAGPRDRGRLVDQSALGGQNR